VVGTVPNLAGAICDNPINLAILADGVRKLRSGKPNANSVDGSIPLSDGADNTPMPAE
jgi:hypothetical protein